jgi:hypothetical protein
MLRTMSPRKSFITAIAFAVKPVFMRATQPCLPTSIRMYLLKNFIDVNREIVGVSLSHAFHETQSFLAQRILRRITSRKNCHVRTVYRASLSIRRMVCYTALLFLTLQALCQKEEVDNKRKVQGQDHQQGCGGPGRL